MQAVSNGDMTSNGDVTRLGDERVHMLKDEIDALTVTRDRLLAETEGLLVCVCECARVDVASVFLHLSLSLSLSRARALSLSSHFPPLCLSPCMWTQAEISCIIQRRTRETHATAEAHKASQLAHARLEFATQLLRSVATQGLQLVADTVPLFCHTLHIRTYNTTVSSH